MMMIPITDALLVGGAALTESGALHTITFPAAVGGIELNQLIHAEERYVTFTLKALTEHSQNLQFAVYGKDDPEGTPAFDIRFGVMPNIEALLCFDLRWLDAHLLFPESTPGQMKVVCHGRRMKPEEIDRIILENCPCYHDIQLQISNITLTDTRPTVFPLPDVKLIDPFGQYKNKEWPQKIQSVDMLNERLQQAVRLPDEYPFADWDIYGGLKTKKLAEGTGFFSKAKADGRWYLVDPLGNAFFSNGPDCVVARSDCRVDDLEKFMDWLPDRSDPIYESMYKSNYRNIPGRERYRNCTLFSFEQANLYRVFGDDWHEHWKKLMVRQLKNAGLNTLGNWSERDIQETGGMPYVTMLPEFPTTELKIFRDFPDVFSEEYLQNAQRCAEFLSPMRDDPYLIGYFLRNEPSWAFVNGLVIADEVLYNGEPSACKDKLIHTLISKYETPEKLSEAWAHSFDSFDDLRQPLYRASKFSKQAAADLRAFSREMLGAYTRIPSKACRSADPNHMNLGMRWAWISDPDIVTGWDAFDVFSINCYAVDPTAALNNVVALGVDLPIMIGEFHFGALDGGVTATGLEGVQTQAERGVAYRYYSERVASHPNGVGCHYFQCYDQFELGRFDGENYNIGLFDICSQPSADMMSAIRESAATIYQVVDGSRPPAERKPKSIPMIAY